nr:PREDICTED: proline-rich acidic protein 1 [Struthio camelus australis]
MHNGHKPKVSLGFHLASKPAKAAYIKWLKGRHRRTSIPGRFHMGLLWLMLNQVHDNPAMQFWGPPRRLCSRRQPPREQSCAVWAAARAGTEASGVACQPKAEPRGSGKGETQEALLAGQARLLVGSAPLVRTLAPGGRQARWVRAGRAGTGTADAASQTSAKTNPVCLRSFAVLVGAALLLQVPGGTQALSNTREKQLPARLALIKEIILGIKAVEPPEEGEITEDVEPGIKVFSSDAQGWRGPLGAQAMEGPEEDRDHLHHPEDNAVEDAAHVQRPALFHNVQSGPEEDRDHIYHS